MILDSHYHEGNIRDGGKIVYIVLKYTVYVQMAAVERVEGARGNASISSPFSTLFSSGYADIHIKTT
jgi:hypothetical protein